MKKIHLCVFFTSILILIVIYSFNCFAKNEEKMNWGEFWLEMNSTQKGILFIGVREGMFYSMLDIFSETSNSGLLDLSDAKKGLFIDYTFKRYNEFHKNIDVLIDIVTSLYKYPENSYIKFIYMIDIAIKKLKGESIEKLLEMRRKGAYEDSD